MKTFSYRYMNLKRGRLPVRMSRILPWSVMGSGGIWRERLKNLWKRAMCIICTGRFCLVILIRIIQGGRRSFCLMRWHMSRNACWRHLSACCVPLLTGIRFCLFWTVFSWLLKVPCSLRRAFWNVKTAISVLCLAWVISRQCRNFWCRTGKCCMRH